MCSLWFCGLLLSGVYALVAATIDVFTFPDLPLGVNWQITGQEMLLTVLGGLALSVIIAWPENTWSGIVLGAGVIVTWAMLRSLWAFGPIGLVFWLFALPLVLWNLPVTAAFRWAVQRQVQRYHRQLAVHAALLLAIVSLGAFAGSWSRMTPASQSAVRRVNTLVQTALHSTAPQPVELGRLPQLREKVGDRFWLSQKASAVSSTGVEVQVNFDNGYVFTCLVEPIGTNSTFCVDGAGSPFGSGPYKGGDKR